ncbi:MAG: divalent metal cation transporter FieF [Kordiimonas sp.]|nr:divalent metal cation transporter FieF [Kordiimonas sp.]
MRWASRASVVVALGLIGLKIWAWLSSGSVSLLGSLIDSSMDVLASLFTLMAVNRSLTPADKNHRFGHGKIEAIASLLQVVVIGLSAIYLLSESVMRLFNPVEVQAIELGIWIMLLTIGVTLCLVLFQRYVAKETGSLAIEADSLHYKSDLLMNAGVIVALLLTGYLGWGLADPVLGIFIALYIAYGAWEIFQSSLDMLMDRELDTETRLDIVREVMKHPECRGVHDLRTRQSGLNTFIQFHLVLDPDMTLARAHDISDEVEAMVMKAFPDSDVLIHSDPEGLEEDHLFAEPLEKKI